MTLTDLSICSSARKTPGIGCQTSNKGSKFNLYTIDGTCNGSATELGAFHDGRDGMHVARVGDRQAWVGNLGWRVLYSVLEARN